MNALINSEISAEEQRLDALNALDALVQVEKEKAKRRIKRLERLGPEVTSTDGLHPAWETRTRNTVLFATIARVLSVYN